MSGMRDVPTSALLAMKRSYARDVKSGTNPTTCEIYRQACDELRRRGHE